MLPLVLLAAAATAPVSPPSSAVVRQAKVSVRILSGERITAERLPAIAIVNETKVRGPDGVDRPARLVEFP